MSESKLGSRAVVRRIEPGLDAECPWCELRLKFKARVKQNQVICNVYVDGKWNRVEHYHQDCYLAAEYPHGEPQEAA
jgi:hypothetical protein